MQHFFDHLGAYGKMTGWRQLSGLMLLTAVLYAVSGQLSFSAAVSNQIVTPVFFAAEGFALAAVLLFGPKMALGVFVGQLALASYNGLGLAPSILISLINASEALLGFYLFRYFKLDARLIAPKDLTGLLVLIFFVLQPFSATLGNLVLWHSGVLSGWGAYIESWESWWLGNSMGQAHLAPALLFLAAQPLERIKKLGRESLLPLLSLLGVSLIVFNKEFTTGLPLPLVIFTPLLMWLAIRGRLGWVCLGSSVLSIFVLRATATGVGPFVSVDGQALLFDMNVFLLGLSLTAQFVAVLYEERNLYEEALIESRNSERRASRAKTDFLANVSHEIRTPMNAVLGMTWLAKEKSDTPAAVREMLEDAYRSGRSLLVLLDQILDFSKIEAGRMKTSREPVDLIELLSDLKALFKISATQRKLQFDIEVLTNNCPRTIQADPLRLKQVLTNLIGNALKFTAEGSVALQLRNVKDQEQEYLQFAVLDTGIGLTEDQRKRIFEAFVQADNSTSKQFGGTGLGLTISQELVQAMGGELLCESTIGKGSRFYFNLPLDSKQGVEALSLGLFDKVRSGKAWQPAQKKRFNGLRVLVVDDHPLNVKIAAAELASLGAEVSTASSGQEALVILQALEVDVVLLDLQMPDMTGNECASKINLLSRSLKNPPAIFAFTAATTLRHDDQQDLLVDGLLTKPLDFDEFEACMRKARVSDAPASNKTQPIE